MIKINILESYDITTPFGTTEECAMFVIDDITAPFNMHNITVVGQQYTLSFWIKADADSSLSVLSETFQVTNDWTYHTITFVANAVNIPLLFLQNGIYYIYHPNLELGNKDSDWTPAPEDVQQDYNDKIANVVNEASLSIGEARNEILLSVSETYYGIDDIDTMFESVGTQLTQTKDAFEMQFTNVTADLNNLANETNAQFEETKKYIRFQDGKILLGALGNQLELQITNDRISFLQSGHEVAYFSNSKLYVTDGEYLNSLKIGKFAFVPRANDSLDFKKVGD